MKTLAGAFPTAIIVGPPWPGGGTARVMQSQVEFYRSRGYMTVFVCVPLHCAFVKSHPGWGDIKNGILELGADQTHFASIEALRFQTAKYTTWFKHGFRGTALDWIVFTAGSARLETSAIRSLQELPVALVHVNHVFTLGFAKNLVRQVVPSNRRVPLILETHDVQAQALKEKREINPWTHQLDSLDELIQSEISHLSKTKVLVHCSIDDLEFFKQRLPRKKHVLAMPTIDEAFVSRVESTSDSFANSTDLLFVGQSTEPNRAALQWFFERVWPLIAERGYRMTIVGRIDALVRECLPEIYRAYSHHFVGPVEELAPFYRSARCVLAPMVSGTGISIKTVEALALGKPFVGTSKAFRGMPMEQIIQAGLQPYDTPEAFTNAIVGALSGECLRAEASRRVYNSLFSKKAAFASRDEVIRVAMAI